MTERNIVLKNAVDRIRNQNGMKLFAVRFLEITSHDFLQCENSTYYNQRRNTGTDARLCLLGYWRNTCLKGASLNLLKQLITEATKDGLTVVEDLQNFLGESINIFCYFHSTLTCQLQWLCQDYTNTNISGLY